MAKSAKGKVTVVSAQRKALLFQLSEGDKPKGGYFLLKVDHEAYEIMSSMIISAAFDPHRSISAFTEQEIVPNEYAVVDHINLT